MAEQKILADFFNGMNKAQLKGFRFFQVGSLPLAESDPSMQAVGTWCQVGGVIYWRQIAGQPLVAVVDNTSLTAQLTALQNTLTNQIAQGNMLTPFNASSATTFPANSKNGQGYYVTSGGTVNGITFTANDVFFAEKDNASSWSDFGDILPIASLATAGVAGVVKIATTLAEYNAAIADTSTSVSAPVIKLLIDTINGTISTLTGRVSALENRLNQKFKVELTDASGVLTESTYTTLQAAVDYAHGQTTTNKRIVVGQDTKITATINLKSTIVIDFTDHDVYATTDITLFDDSLMASTNGGHVEIVGIKDLVVAVNDTVGSTNSILRMTGTGTNRRYRLHARNIFTGISIFKASGIATDGTATCFDLVVDNCIDTVSTSGSIVSSYNDRYGVVTAHHSNRLVVVSGTQIKIFVTVVEFLRCSGFGDISGNNTSSTLLLNCPTVRTMYNYLMSGGNIASVFVISSSLICEGAIIAKSTTGAMTLHFRNSVVRTGLAANITGSVATYHATSDPMMKSTGMGLPAVSFGGACVLNAGNLSTTLYSTADAPSIETWIVGFLSSNIDFNSVVKGGTFNFDNTQGAISYPFEVNAR